MEFIRCYSCGRLNLLVLTTRRKGLCRCGSRTFRGAQPVGLKEHIKAAWWSLTVRV